MLQMFKELGFERAILEKRARAGTPLDDRPGPSHQPPGTRSQSVPYYRMGLLIAICHQYTLPDGGFGASGKPDPKMLQYRGHSFYCHSSPCACPTCKGPPENWREVLKSLSKK
jgi:hypothetical protein